MAQLAAETVVAGPNDVFSFIFSPKLQKILNMIYTSDKCLYIFDFLPKIKVGRPPYLALRSPPPVYRTAVREGLAVSFKDCSSFYTSFRLAS